MTPALSTSGDFALTLTNALADLHNNQVPGPVDFVLNICWFCLSILIATDFITI